MSLQVVVSVERLRALVALEGAVVRGAGLRCWVRIHVHLRRMSTVVAWHHQRQIADQAELAVRVVDVRQDRARKWVGVRAVLRVG